MTRPTESETETKTETDNRMAQALEAEVNRLRLQGQALETVRESVALYRAAGALGQAADALPGDDYRARSRAASAMEATFEAAREAASEALGGLDVAAYYLTDLADSLADLADPDREGYDRERVRAVGAAARDALQALTRAGGSLAEYVAGRVPPALVMAGEAGMADAAMVDRGERGRYVALTSRARLLASDAGSLREAYRVGRDALRREAADALGLEVWSGGAGLPGYLYDHNLGPYLGRAEAREALAEERDRDLTAWAAGCADPDHPTTDPDHPTPIEEGDGWMGYDVGNASVEVGRVRGLEALEALEEAAEGGDDVAAEALGRFIGRGVLPREVLAPAAAEAADRWA